METSSPDRHDDAAIAPSALVPPRRTVLASPLRHTERGSPTPRGRPAATMPPTALRRRAVRECHRETRRRWDRCQLQDALAPIPTGASNYAFRDTCSPCADRVLRYGRRPVASPNSVTGGGPTAASVTGGGPVAPVGTDSVTGGGPSNDRRKDERPSRRYTSIGCHTPRRAQRATPPSFPHRPRPPARLTSAAISTRSSRASQPPRRQARLRPRSVCCGHAPFYAPATARRNRRASGRRSPFVPDKDERAAVRMLHGVAACRIDIARGITLLADAARSR